MTVSIISFLLSLLVAVSFAANCSLLGVWRYADAMQEGKYDYASFFANGTFTLTLEIVNCTVEIDSDYNSAPLSSQTANVTFSDLACGLAPYRPAPVGCALTAQYVCPMLQNGLMRPVTVQFASNCLSWHSTNAPSEQWVLNSTSSTV